jgi:hypothetical protein
MLLFVSSIFVMRLSKLILGLFYKFSVIFVSSLFFIFIFIPRALLFQFAIVYPYFIHLLFIFVTLLSIHVSFPVALSAFSALVIRSLVTKVFPKLIFYNFLFVFRSRKNNSKSILRPPTTFSCNQPKYLFYR